jgi:hypothetical protein
MEEPMDNGTGPDPNVSKDFKRLAVKRIVVVVLLALVVLWVIATVAGFFSVSTELAGGPEPSTTALQGGTGGEAGGTSASYGSPMAHGAVADSAGQVAHGGAETAPTGGHATVAKAPAGAGHGTSSTVSSGHAAPAPHAPQTAQAAPGAPGAPAAVDHGGAPAAPRVPGVALVDAVIKPMKYELYDRFWGWRPNDILNFTDNVNNYQLGVLEVTRRTAVILAERISRAGSTEAFDKNLENAMNWFMVSADKYWFPSPEGKYKEGLKELAAYRDRLKIGNARFWTRTDSLIPLLIAYEDLLGSCDENLVKAKEEDGSDVSFFAADDYFFYAKGVANALYEILHAVETDFYVTLEARRGLEVLRHAIESCHHAIEIDPIVITNASLSGILANHRANLAAPISHARFYLGVLIETLST